MRNTKHKRGGKAGLTTARAARIPATAILSYSNHDVKRGRLVPDTHIAAVVERIIKKDWTPLDHECPVLGTSGECFRTAMIAQELRGGTIHMGWLVRKTSTNNTEVTAHAVWELDAIIYETIPEYRNYHFILDDAIPFGSQMGIDFSVDVFRHAPVEANIFKRAIDMRRTKRVLSPPDPTQEQRIEEVREMVQPMLAA